MAAFMGIVMVGFLAVALDVGYLFHEKRMAQAAADAAAVAAAEELSNGTTAEQNAANAMATLNGFNTSAATNPATVTLSSSTSGNYSNTASTAPTTWVTATVSQPIQTFFLGAFAPTMSKLTVAATATAAADAASSNCVCLQGGVGHRPECKRREHTLHQQRLPDLNELDEQLRSQRYRRLGSVLYNDLGCCEQLGKYG